MLICKQELRSNIWLDWARRLLRQRDADADAKTMYVNFALCGPPYMLRRVREANERTRVDCPGSIPNLCHGEGVDFSLVPV
jgi:hypothetical protein